jgi:hypothetical protein
MGGIFICMKYIITENQYNILVEDNMESHIKRRSNEDSVRFFINVVLGSISNKCEDFADEFDYTDKVIDMLAHVFLVKNKVTYKNPKYDKYYDTLIDMCKQWFGEELFDRYRWMCEDNEI